MASTYVNDNGTWRTVKSVYVNDGTAWRNVKNKYVNDGGTWRLVFSAGFFVYSETISTPTANYNLRTNLTAAGWNGTDDVDASITINPAVVVYSTATSTAAFTLSPALPAGSTVSLRNAGTIVGKGGAGGSGGDATLNAGTPNGSPTTPFLTYPISFANGGNGGVGGRGMTIASPITINNSGGVIASGGGGGGGGKAYSTTSTYGNNGVCVGGSGGSGGGGSSQSVAAAGPAGTVPTSLNGRTDFARANGTAGSSGSTAGGATEPGVPLSNLVPSFPATFVAVGGTGGAGGARGSAGSAGGAGSGSTTPAPYGVENSSTSAGAGGSAGVAIQGYSLVTFPAVGTVTGPTSG